MKNVDLAVDFAFDKFHMRNISGELVEHRIKGDPTAEPNFRPSMVVKCAAQINDADDRLRRNPCDARLVGIEMAKACIEAFLATPFGGERHVRRVEKLSKMPQDA